MSQVKLTRELNQTKTSHETTHSPTEETGAPDVITRSHNGVSRQPQIRDGSKYCERMPMVCVVLFSSRRKRARGVERKSSDTNSGSMAVERRSADTTRTLAQNLVLTSTNPVRPDTAFRVRLHVPDATEHRAHGSGSRFARHLKGRCGERCGRDVAEMRRSSGRSKGAA